jgi:hypothetical protein
MDEGADHEWGGVEDGRVEGGDNTDRGAPRGGSAGGYEPKVRRECRGEKSRIVRVGFL